MSRGLELFAEAAPKAARLLGEDFAADKKPEARLRQCFIQAVLDTGTVTATAPELGGSGELPPDLPEWPNAPKSRLGGVDLAVRVEGDAGDSWR